MAPFEVGLVPVRGEYFGVGHVAVISAQSQPSSAESQSASNSAPAASGTLRGIVLLAYFPVRYLASSCRPMTRPAAR